jgi:uncharacterized membrane protein YhaH (DUF805 family)
MPFFLLASYIFILLPMRIWEARSVLFSFNGRIDRKRYWIALGLQATFALIYGGVLSGIVEAGTLERGASELNYRVWQTAALTILIAVPVGVSATAIGVKRLHDRNRTGWWLLGSYLPAVAGIAIANWPAVQDNIRIWLGTLVVLPLLAWIFIDLGCRRGTIGPNRFGDDPIIRQQQPKPQ